MPAESFTLSAAEAQEISEEYNISVDATLLRLSWRQSDSVRKQGILVNTSNMPSTE
jgi:hypothetical protein